jgi:hypothetical protein
MGSLFKSQNGSIWTANQYQDLKFKLYKAEFTSPAGTAFFYNPTLDKSNGYVEKLINNPLKTLPKTATLGITTSTSLGSILTNGRKIAGSQPHTYGYVVGTGSSVSSVGLTTGGSNYVTDSDVETFNIIGKGSGLKLNITASNGVITGTPVIVSRGNGYAVGDVVGIVTSSAGNRGTGAYISISGNGTGIDTLYLSGIQGTAFQVGAGLSYYNDAGTIVSLASTTIRTPLVIPGNQNSGNYIKVDHFDHGMYSNTNKLVISGAESNVPATVLSTQLLSTDISIVSIADTSNFGTFEGILVSGSNPGYIKIENEIISYTSVGSGTLNGVVRGIDLTKTLDYEINSIVYKYEMNGVSLRRINRSHDISDSAIGIDDYHIEIDRSENGVDRSVDTLTFPELSFASESNIGGSNVYATSNITYNALVPSYEVITPSNTSVTATIRTTSGTSVGGNETSFLDNGFEPVQLNTLNVLESVRLVCSKENETAYLGNLPRNKSFTTGITLNSSDKYLSPVIYLGNSTTEFRNNRLDNPISDYTKDSRVNSITNDPHASSYVSRLVSLTQPAASLKVILSAYRHSSSDFRVLYSLVRSDSSEVPQAFELFPGYNNLQYTNTDEYSIIDPAKNDGLPDLFVRPSLDGEFLEYQFTADNLDLFTGYAIKIVMSGTNQAYPVRIKELRAIAVR